MLSYFSKGVLYNGIIIFGCPRHHISLKTPGFNMQLIQQSILPTDSTTLVLFWKNSIHYLLSEFLKSDNIKFLSKHLCLFWWLVTHDSLITTWRRKTCITDKLARMEMTVDLEPEVW